MANGRLANLVDSVRGLIRPASGDAQTDRVLLERFARHGDQSAFATLVERHAGMVRGVCRRILGDAAEADDAFQATFLILVSKRRSVRWHESLAGWLWAVAYRVASKARTRAARRQRHETEAGRMMSDTHHPAEPDDGLRDALHQELARLPEKYRLPLVLCYLEGHTTDEAAAQLGWPRGSVAGRLARAREVLRRRLGRRQLAPTPAAIAAALAATAAPAPAATVVATVHAASLLVLGTPLTQLGVSATAVSLTQGVLADMFHAKLKIVAGAVLVLLGLGIGIGRWVPTELSSRAEAAPIPGEVAKPDTTPPRIRHLEIARDPKAPLPQDRPGVTVFTTQKEAEAAVDAFTGKQLAEKVDFTKEKVAYVRWSSGGPPFNTLEAEVKKGDDGFVVTFVQKSSAKPGQPRGRALRIGQDFFAVPTAVKVALPNENGPPQERILDAVKEAPAPNRRAPAEAELPKVRKLTLKPDPKAPVGKGVFEVIVLESEKAVAEATTDAIAKQIADQVDFTKEKVVRVNYSSAGPPFDTVEFELKKDGDKHRVRFFQKVLPVPRRGEALKFGQEFYAVPKTVAVTPAPKAP